MVHGSAPQRNGNRQYRVDLTSGRAELLPTSGVSAHSALSPDGQGILVGVGGLKWHDLKSGEITTPRPPENNVAFLSPKVSPDSKRIAYWNARAGATSVIEIASVTGSDVRVVCECPYPGTYSPLNVLAWMPDQRHLVYADPVGTLWRVPTDGGAREPLGVSVPPRVQALSVHPDGRGLYFTARQESNPPELWVLENYLPRASAK